MRCRRPGRSRSSSAGVPFHAIGGLTIWCGNLIQAEHGSARQCVHCANCPGGDEDTTAVPRSATSTSLVSSASSQNALVEAMIIAGAAESAASAQTSMAARPAASMTRSGRSSDSSSGEARKRMPGGSDARFPKVSMVAMPTMSTAAWRWASRVPTRWLMAPQPMNAARMRFWGSEGFTAVIASGPATSASRGPLRLDAGRLGIIRPGRALGLLGDAVHKHELAYVLEMLSHGAAGILAAMRQDGVNDLTVAFGALDADGLDGVGAMPLAMDVPHDLFMQVDQRSVSGAAHDAEVKVIVEVVIARRIAAPGRRVACRRRSA